MGWHRAVCALVGSVIIGSSTMPAVAAERCKTARSIDRVASAVVPGRLLRFDSMTCGDTKSGITCIAVSGSSMMLVDAVVLGPSTSVSIAERLLDCKRSGDAAPCRFAVAVKPTAVEASPRDGHGVFVKIFARDVDLEAATCTDR